METTSPVMSITDEQIAEIEAVAEQANARGLRSGLITPQQTLLALISRLRAAERELRLWSPIIDEVHRRAGKECCLEDQCDFTVTVAYEDYAAIDTAMKGEQQ